MKNLYQETMEQIEPSEGFSAEARCRLASAAREPQRPKRSFRPGYLAAALIAALLLTGSAFGVSALIRQNDFRLYTSAEDLQSALPKDEFTPWSMSDMRRESLKDFMPADQVLATRADLIEEYVIGAYLREGAEIFSDETADGGEGWIRKVTGQDEIGPFAVWQGDSVTALCALQDHVDVDLSCLDAAFTPVPGGAFLILRGGEKPSLELSGVYGTPEGGAVTVTVSYALWAAEFGDQYVLADEYRFKKKLSTADGVEVTCFMVENRSEASAIFARGAFYLTGIDTDAAEQALIKQIRLGNLPETFSRDVLPYTPTN